jgi:aconitate hydratase
VAAAMGGAPYFLQMPKVVNIRLHGRLRPWVSAKDVVLKVLSLLSTKGNVGTVIEYSGSALETLTIPERATITNMGAELGVTTSIFPSDRETLRFLRAQGREADFARLSPDEDARYHKVVDIDLADLKPMVAGPHSPDNVTTVAEIAGRPVDQVCIGSCTNASYKDIATAAKILEGRTVHHNVSLVVVPGSRQVWQMASDSGALSALAAAGARVLEPTCGFCIGLGQSPGSGATSVRTNNRNFEGRSGTKDAKVYLVSPETAAVTALTGALADPTSFGDPPIVVMPEKFLINDNMIITPPQDASSVTIRRGPNIGNPPKIEPFPEDLRARVSIVVGDKITTDHIMPAGSRLIYRSNIEKYSQFVFEGIDPAFHERCRDNRDQGFWNIIVAGASYGQGSSREHAALCPAFLGVRAVIAGSFERIHAANLINFGILPLRLVRLNDQFSLSIGDEIVLREIRKELFSGSEITVRNETKGIEFPVVCELTDRQKQMVMIGGLLNFMKDQRAGK